MSFFSRVSGSKHAVIPISSYNFQTMEDEDEGGGETSSFVVGSIENRSKEVGVAAFDMRSASLHLSQYIETSSSYQSTKMLQFYDHMVIIIPPNKLAADAWSSLQAGG